MNSLFTHGLVLILGVATGYMLFGTDHNMHSNMQVISPEKVDMNTSHQHTMLEVDTELPVPTVAIEAFKDEKDGYNIHIQTENFTLTPDQVNRDPVQGGGHAHLNVNGHKVARLYGDWFNLPSSTLRDDENIIEVTLNANDHSEWVIDGQHISDTTVVPR